MDKVMSDHCISRYIKLDEEAKIGPGYRGPRIEQFENLTWIKYADDMEEYQRLLAIYE